MKLIQVLQANKMMIVFLEILYKKAFHFIPPHISIPQIPFTNRYQQKHIQPTLLNQRREDKVIILDQLWHGKYFL